MDAPAPNELIGELTRLSALAAAVQARRSPLLVTALERSRGRREELVERIQRLDHALPDYASIPEDEIRQVVVTLLELGLDLITTGRPPAEAEFQVVYDLVQVHARQGVSASSFMLAVQLGVSEFLSVFDEEAHAAQLAADEVLVLHDAVRELTNLLVATLSTAYRERDLREERDLAHRQAALLRSLSFGHPDPIKLTRMARSIGLDPDAGFYALHVPLHGPDPRRARVLRRAMLDAAPGAIAAIVEDRVVGLATRRPFDRPQVTVMGCSGPVPLRELADAFTEARGAAELAVELGIHGLVGYPDLGPLPLLIAAGDAAAALDRRHCAPLDAEGRLGQDIAQTVARYLANDHNVDATAAELHVHRNTVHHRLRRFRELTDLDVRRTEHLVLAWWLLGRRSLGGTRTPTPAAR